MKTIWLTAILMLCTSAAWSQRIEIKDVYPGEIKVKAFEMSQKSTVSVRGVAGVFPRNWKALAYYTWILDSETREVVWHLLDERSRMDDDGLFDFDLNVELDKGTYELYFTGANGSNWRNERNMSASNFSELMDNIFSSRRRRDAFRDRYVDDLKVAVESSVLRELDIDDVINAKTKEAVLSFTHAREDESFEKGFTLTAETELDLYVLGEGERDELFDYLWIYDAASRERVFEMSYRKSESAGGADKNLKVRRRLTLPAGSYIASYVTDDSHSYNDWNAMPPDDPEFWGVTIWPASENDRKNVVEFVKPKVATPLIDLTKVRDDELVSEGLHVTGKIEVKVLCLGEASGNDRLVDYGWIIDANTRKKVWEMDLWDVEHAGGASKNKRVEDKITLNAGDYIVYYATDDSHAYRDWNDTKPHEDEFWGISIWAIEESDLEKVSKFNPRDFKNENVIAEITMVGDDEYLKEVFELDVDTEVIVTGLGEGSSGDMDDFGYIKNMDTGRVVWEMRYRDSEHGGGARKNREFRERLTLKKGKYRIVYETDGSHSYRKWNADPPRNPERWGVSIIRK